MSVGFEGFTESHFSGARDAAESAVRDLATTVSSQLSKDELRRLGDLEYGASGRGPLERSPNSAQHQARRQNASVGVTLSNQGILLALDALSDEAANAFLQLMEDASSLQRLQSLEGFEVVLLERRPENYESRYSAKRARWSSPGQLVPRRQYRAEELHDAVRDELIADCRAFDGRWEKHGFSIRRQRTPREALARGGDLASDLVPEIQALVPVVARLNSLVRQAQRSSAPALERAPWRAPG